MLLSKSYQNKSAKIVEGAILLKHRVQKWKGVGNNPGDAIIKAKVGKLYCITLFCRYYVFCMFKLVLNMLSFPVGGRYSWCHIGIF